MITRKILAMAVGIFLSLTAQTKEQPDSALYSRHARLFNTFDQDSTAAFYDISAQLQRFYKQHGQLEDYYNLRRIEIRYEADRGQYANAIRKANAALAEIKEEKEGRQYSDMIYCSLGNAYIRGGNPRMAIHCYNEALKYVTPADSSRYIHAYAGLAHAYIISDPDKALELNEHVGELLKLDSLYYKVYLAHKVQIYFYKGDKENFLKAAKVYEQLINDPASPKYQYGEKMIGIMENAMTDNHNEVLRGLEDLSNDVGRMDARIRIYESMGRQDLALQEAYRRIEVQDSFTHGMMHENLEELDEVQTINEQQRRATKEREFWMIVAIIALVFTIMLIVLRYFLRRRYQKQIMRQNEQIKRQNEQLEIALDEAKESERMKATFIQHISHEMRTPLNIINGYSQIIADPNYELDQENRDLLLQAIDQNTTAMTNIINDLLTISNDSSRERYHRDEHIVVNDLCHNMMSRAEEKNKGRLELKFNTALPNDFAILSNRDGIERIIRQLMKNSRIFTEQGSIELSVRLSDDGHNVQFAVTDTGIGIPEEHHEQVFEQFYKIDTFKQGLGIGLPMSRKIAILLGGSLEIDKNYHGGTRMILTIPTGTQTA